MTLHVAADLDLPDDLVTQKVAILAMSGAGKSNAAVVLAEEFYDAKIPWVAIDPKGDWHGVLSSADGKKAGLEVPVLGGTHGHIPLEPTGGKTIANLIADRGLTCVLDVSEFDSKAAQSRFLTDLAETLLRRNRTPLHLFLEEADEYLPQRFSSRSGDVTAACVGAWQRLVKRGRFRGLGVTLITQRSAALNKDALNQVDTVIAMRVTAPRDKKAIEEWIVEKSLGKELVESLPSLEDGEAWIWSPQKLKMTRRVRFRRRRTFDSGDTPTVGAAREPTRLADVDLDEVKAAMAETVKRAQAEDPKLLQARIRELERELKRQPAPTVETVERIVEAVPDWLMEAVVTADARLNAVVGSVTGSREALSGALARVAAEGLRKSEGTGSRPNAAERVPASARSTSTALQGVTPPKVPPVPRTSPAAIVHDMVGQIGAKSGAMRMLVAAAQFPAGLTKSQLATQAKMKKTGGSYTTYLSRLRTAGLITVQGDTVQITDRGLDVAGISDIRALVGDELIESWQERLGRDNGCRRMFDLLVAIHPGSYSKEALAERAEVERSGGSFGTYLSRLRSNGLIVVEGDDVRASETLFM